MTRFLCDYVILDYEKIFNINVYAYFFYFLWTKWRRSANRINEAIESATNTSTTTTTLPEKECNEYLFTVLNIFAIIEDELKSLPSDSEAASYELHTEYYAKKSAKLKSQESRISQIRSRTATELDILIELEEYRSLSFSYASKSLFGLLNFVPIDGPDFKEMMNFMELALPHRCLTKRWLELKKHSKEIKSSHC